MVPPGTAPFGITVGLDGNVWFTQRYASMIGRITPRGHITEFPLPLPPHAARGTDDVVSIAPGPDGAVCFLQQQTNELGCLAAWRVWLEAVMDPSWNPLFDQPQSGR
jgi:virginiamycin B lyase